MSDINLWGIFLRRCAAGFINSFCGDVHTSFWPLEYLVLMKSGTYSRSARLKPAGEFQPCGSQVRKCDRRSLLTDTRQQNHVFDLCILFIYLFMIVVIYSYTAHFNPLGLILKCFQTKVVLDRITEYKHVNVDKHISKCEQQV